MRWHMHKRTEQKEDGRLIYYYTFTPAEPSVPPDEPDGSDKLEESDSSGQAEPSNG